MLQATYFGTSSILLTDGTTSLLTDGFFSRPPLLRVRFGRVSPDLTRIADTLTRAHIDTLDAVLVAHSHLDHAMDAPEVARRTGATMYGSESTMNVGRGWGLDEDSMRVIDGGDEIAMGDFVVRVFVGEHSPGDFAPGVISDPLTPPCRAKDYRTGACYSFLVTHPDHTVLIHPSANFVPHAFDGLDVDTLYLGIGGLGAQTTQFQDDYWRHVVDATDPSLIVPVHWDNFGRSLDRPMRPLPFFVDRFARSRDLLTRRTEGTAREVRFQDAYETIDLVGS
ncbi:MBL fold metallo-hydrolase [Williamsia sp. Leaf354]|uniref:MBL fold metallo-hydrolase n=1 Tax=Williamsia sp. Leaf354 TaxID=1736349 RepID=UPI000ACFC3EA|nr:MBL fold metallo-hydrolase [Williamsia sp. Leaf354]